VFTGKSLFVLVGVVAFAMVALMALWTTGLRNGSADPVQAAALKPDSIMPDSTTGAPLPSSAPSYAAVLNTATFSATFPKFGGLGGWSEVVANVDCDKGPCVERKKPGKWHVKDITLARSLSSNFDLWNWFQQILDGKIDVARVNGSITIVEVGPTAMAPIAKWTFVGGWPCAYDVSPDPAVTGSSAETVKICYEKLKREALK